MTDGHGYGWQQQGGQLKFSLKFDTDNMDLSNEIDKWKQSRQSTVSSLHQLSRYIENIGHFSRILITFRETVFCQSIHVAEALVGSVVEVCQPYVIAGVGIKLATYLSRLARLSGRVTGVCLGVAGGALTLLSGRITRQDRHSQTIQWNLGGEGMSVVSAGVTMIICNGVTKLLGHLLGHDFVGRMLIVTGGFIMTISISTGLVIVLTGVSLYWAVPALTREILNSKFSKNVFTAIHEDKESSQQLFLILEQVELTEEEQVLRQNVMYRSLGEDTNQIDIVNLDECLRELLNQNNATGIELLANNLELTLDVNHSLNKTK